MHKINGNVTLLIKIINFFGSDYIFTPSYISLKYLISIGNVGGIIIVG